VTSRAREWNRTASSASQGRTATWTRRSCYETTPNTNQLRNLAHTTTQTTPTPHTTKQANTSRGLASAQKRAGAETTPKACRLTSHRGNKKKEPMVAGRLPRGPSRRQRHAVQAVCEKRSLSKPWTPWHRRRWRRSMKKIEQHEAKNTQTRSKRPRLGPRTSRVRRAHSVTFEAVTARIVRRKRASAHANKLGDPAPASRRTRDLGREEASRMQHRGVEPGIGRERRPEDCKFASERQNLPESDDEHVRSPRESRARRRSSRAKVPRSASSATRTLITPTRVDSRSSKNGGAGDREVGRRRGARR